MDFQSKLNSGYYSNSGGLPYVSRKEARNDPAKAAAKERYEAMNRQRHAEFKADAFAELGITGHPKAEQLFDKAWGEGHVYGYHEVWSKMQDLVDLIL